VGAKTSLQEIKGSAKNALTTARSPKEEVRGVLGYHQAHAIWWGLFRKTTRTWVGGEQGSVKAKLEGRRGGSNGGSWQATNVCATVVFHGDVGAEGEGGRGWGWQVGRAPAKI